jgi:MFS family permease
MLPYMMGILAEMDDRGRWAVAVDALWWLGAAPGAAVAGLVFQAGGYSGLFAVPLIAGLACIVVLTQVLRKFYASQEK